MMFRKILKWWSATSFYLTTKVYVTAFAAGILFSASYFFPLLFEIGTIIIVVLFTGVLLDSFLLYRQRNGVSAQRFVAKRWSNGDDNKVEIEISSHYDFATECHVIDELPFQFQKRKGQRLLKLAAAAKQRLAYYLRPVERGVYAFGNINIFVRGPLQLVRRRLTVRASQSVKVYPSFVQMRRFSLTAAAHTNFSGIKKLRRLGHSLEFDQIKDYIPGDDNRLVNWKATARRGSLMVNSFTDERRQQVYCVINKGRAMKMPFNGMTLLDYAINAALVIANVALQRHDRAGLITFEKSVNAFLPAANRPAQISKIAEVLYNQETGFAEPDYEQLFSVVRNQIAHRSLLILFTNFLSIESLRRELPVLKQLSRYHLVLVVFFKNTELKQLTKMPVKSVEDVYVKTIAAKFRHDEKLMQKELQAHGILALLTRPEALSINTLNKYLELKKMQRI